MDFPRRQAFLRTCLYNPHTVAKAFRPCDISDVLKIVDIVVLPGTKLKNITTTCHHTTYTTSHIAVNSGYDSRAEFSNSSAGVAVWLRRASFFDSHVVSIRPAPPQLHGRGLAVAIRKGSLRLNVVAV